MRSAIDLAKLLGLAGNILVSGQVHGRFVRTEKGDGWSHADEAGMNAEADEVPAAHLFRRRYD